MADLKGVGVVGGVQPQTGNLTPGGPITIMTSNPTPAVEGQNTGTDPKNSIGVRGNAPQGIGVWAESQKATALWAQGNAHVTGTLTVDTDIVLSNAADFAEEFDVTSAADAEPGTVMVLDGEGGVRQGSEPYDRKVAGIVSGAGDYRPGLVMDKRTSTRSRAALALVGKVYCKADASYGPIAVGDLLTTSATPGHAMKASDPARAFGTVIGKALAPLAAGRGLVPVLVALQ